MPTATQFPWHGVVVVIITVLTVYLLIALVLKLAECVTSVRDELRERYVSDRWKPVPIDMLALPIWIALEILGFVAAIAFAPLTLFVAYQAAKGVRDWWHSGERQRGR